MLYDFNGVKVEVKETKKPLGMKEPVSIFVDGNDGIRLEWIDLEEDGYEELKFCEHCDEPWYVYTRFSDFSYQKATDIGLDVTYRVDIEEDPDWTVLVCPVCAKKFKEMGLKEFEW